VNLGCNQKLVAGWFSKTPRAPGQQNYDRN
jgi:hypothetical protein